MSQLLSACRHSDDFDARKSRRSLFISGTAELEDAPEPKRRRSADDFSTILQKTDNGFSHSSTSPFKSIDDGRKDLTPCSPKQSSPKASLDHSSPEQKILLERQKQQKLLEEQRGFDSQDERWKRMERQLEKAFPNPGPSRPMMVHQSSSPLPYDELVEQSSVAIQASLIDDVSPLKPLSYYRKLKSPWKDPGSLQSSRQASATPSPIQFQNNCALNSMSNPHALTPTPILPATERPIQVNNSCPSNTIFLQIPAQPGNGGSVLWATATPPSGNSTPSPDQLIKVMGQTVNTPLLYSPRSLTPTPEPGNVDLSQVSSVVEFTTPCMTMGDVQQPLAGNQPVNSGNAIPSNQALTIQLPTMHHLSSAEMFSSSPVSGSLAHLQFNTPVMKLTDINKVVPIETPTTTVQLLADVSKRLSLPLNSHQPS